jgi:hypothetical protein
MLKITNFYRAVKIYLSSQADLWFINKFAQILSCILVRFLRKKGYNLVLMKIIHKKIFCLLFAAICFAGCNKKTGIVDNQAIYFQFDYINYAWGYQHTGFIIDNEGKVLTYKNPQNWNFPDKNFNLSDSQLRDNIGSCIYSGKTISEEEFKKYISYIKNISSSKVTALKNVAADAGTTDYICYVFSPDSNNYKGYIIKQEGDFTCENLNFYSKKVAIWLKNINDSISSK